MQKLHTELTLRGLSEQTKKLYVFYNKKFLETIQKTENEVSDDDIKLYLASLINEGKAVRTVNAARAALLFYYNEVLEKGFKK